MEESLLSQALKRAANDQSAQPSSQGWLPEVAYVRLCERGKLPLQLRGHLFPTSDDELMTSGVSLTWLSLESS